MRDRISRESEEVALIEINIRGKKWGEGPIEYLRRQTKIQTDAAAELLSLWHSMTTKLQDHGEDVVKLRELKLESVIMTTRTNAVQEANKIYKTDVVGELKK